MWQVVGVKPLRTYEMAKAPLIEARERAGLSQGQVAMLLSTSKSLIEGFESGLVRPIPLVTLTALALLYDCGVCYLRGEFTSADLSQESRHIIDQIKSKSDKEIMTIILTIMESRKREE